MKRKEFEHECEDFARRCVQAGYSLARQHQIYVRPFPNRKEASAEMDEIARSLALSIRLVPEETSRIERPQHVCGLSGFGRGVDGLNDRCPACEAKV